MTTERSPITSLGDYTLLGRSGLRVSPLCLGTMTFGTEWGWGADALTARAIFRRYLEAGGNFIDTADGYTEGRSEELLGTFMAEAKNRDRIVLGTKFSFSGSPGDPNAGGNGRKNIHRALEGSLRRLRTDYVDLYWLHAWDTVTPVEEVMETLDALVRQGKVRYVGLSNVPSWYLARAQTLAELRGQARICGLQLEYSLSARQIELEYVPAALELGLGILPWSPLAGGLLTGKYRRGAGGTGEGEGVGRLKTERASRNPLFHRFTEHNWQILDTLLAVASELGKSPAQVALAWVTRRPGVTSSVIGVTKPEQLEDNLAALEFALPAPLAQRLDAVSQPEIASPYLFFQPTMREFAQGARVAAEPAWFRRR